MDRLAKNMEALRTLRGLQNGDRLATVEDQRVLARFTSWGALPDVFDSTKDRFASVRDELRGLLSESELRQARRTILNAHYTDPRLIAEVWKALNRLGFDGGYVLEPGAGTGGFIGLAPDHARMVGIELDSVSAGIASALYPSAIIRHESFAETHLPPASFEATVGNVPFGNYVLHDRLHNPHGHSIHNHFIIKALDYTRPGGIVAVLTSRHTLDSANTAARREMSDRADLVAAVRLPAGAHLELAGTEAVTDLLILRVRPDGVPPRDQSWVQAQAVTMTSSEGQEVQLTLNAWWDHHPNTVLGEHGVGHGMYGPNTLTVTAEPGQSTHTRFAETLGWVVDRAVSENLTFTSDDQAASRVASLANVAQLPSVLAPSGGDPQRYEGYMAWDGTRVTSLEHGIPQPVQLPASHIAPVRALIAIRDTQMSLLEAEVNTDQDTDEIRALRAQLNEHYDTFTAAYGPINKVTISTTSRLDRNGDRIVSRRKPGYMRAFETDPFSAVVKGLEIYDEERQLATKAAIFTDRVINRAASVTTAETPEDALAITLDTHGRVDLAHVADLLSTTQDHARLQLADLVFEDPAVESTGQQQLIPRAQYLSGNVRRKLIEAEEAALENPALHANVTALREVIPSDLTPGEIKAQLGSVWIPASDVQDFMRETLRDRQVTVDHAGGSRWYVKGGIRTSSAATQTWGTERIPAHVIVDRLLQQKAILIKDTVPAEGGVGTARSSIPMRPPRHKRRPTRSRNDSVNGCGATLNALAG